MEISLEAVQRAAAAITDDIVRTPTLRSITLSRLAGVDVHVKFENLQFTGSFKDRGSAYHLQCLTPEQRERGVIALSAGNHAQGVAYHAGRLGIEATIVMPATAPFSKVAATKTLGATVVQAGSTVVEAGATAEELQARHGYCYIPPYDDPAVIAGQGTVALEMLADAPELDTLVVPIGGGGLIAGMAVAARALHPSIRIVGVEIAAYPTVAEALAGRTPPAPTGGTLADGIAVSALGELTFPLIRDLVDDVVVVSESSTERAIALYLEIEKTVAEGAGAVSLAAVLDHGDRVGGSKVGVVLSGGNIDMRVLASVLMQRLVNTGRISTIRMRIDDRPGQLAPVVDTIADTGANVIEIDHRRLFDPISARSTNIDVVVETRDAHHRAVLIEALAAVVSKVDVIG
ncbi:MAG: threonine ammonia-lyase [Acidimicrobiales bacterium]